VVESLSVESKKKARRLGGKKKTRAFGRKRDNSRGEKFKIKVGGLSANPMAAAEGKKRTAKENFGGLGRDDKSSMGTST